MIASRKDHFPLPFMDKMLEKISRKMGVTMLLKEFSGYFQSRLTHLIKRSYLPHAITGHLLSSLCPFEVMQCPGHVPKSGIGGFSNLPAMTQPSFEKNTPFIFIEECIEAFENLKMSNQAAILVAND
ncbi:hypothetical protein Tco_1378326 [Tanacetum coccineum]